MSMLIKKVTCTVKEGMRQPFSEGQERWGDLRECKGFIAQYGGWSKGNVANIIAFWDDAHSYHHFMNQAHDVIYNKTNQKESMGSINVQIEEMNVQDIDQFARKWLHYEDSVANEKWIMTQLGGKK